MNLKIVVGVILFMLMLLSFSLTSEAWQPLMSGAADASGMEGAGHWFFENWLGIMFGFGAIVMIATGLYGGGD